MFDTTELGSQRISSLQRRYLNIAWENKLLLKLETDVLSQLKERAEGGAIQVFADNLQDLLMAAPAGAIVYWCRPWLFVMGLNWR